MRIYWICRPLFMASLSLSAITVVLVMCALDGFVVSAFRR